MIIVLAFCAVLSAVVITMLVCKELIVGALSALADALFKSNGGEP